MLIRLQTLSFIHKIQLIIHLLNHQLISILIGHQEFIGIQFYISLKLMLKKNKIGIKGIKIGLFSKNEDDYISITDIAKYKNKEATGLVISH